MTRLVIALAVVAALGGCGGGDDNGSDGGGPTRDEFVADANAICREGEQRIDEVTAAGREPIQGTQSPRERERAVGDLLERTAEEYRPYLDRLRELEPPGDLAGDWRRFLDRITEAFDLIPELADATRENSEERLSELASKFSDIAEDTRPFAETNGLDDCLPEEGEQE